MHGTRRVNLYKQNCSKLDKKPINKARPPSEDENLLEYVRLWVMRMSPFYVNVLVKVYVCMWMCVCVRDTPSFEISNTKELNL